MHFFFAGLKENGRPVYLPCRALIHTVSFMELKRRQNDTPTSRVGASAPLPPTCAPPELVWPVNV